MVCGSIYFLCLFDFILTRYEKCEVLETKVQKDDFTIKMILGVLNIVYLVFCIIQIKSLFIRNIDINYAHYARQGFFQLMIVSVINLVTILVAKKKDKKNKYIQVMSIIMIIFTFILLLSSAVRMYFYENAYGYTLLRLLVYCALFTESVLLIPTCFYIINRDINLPKVYFIIIITIYVGMNFANLDNIIAKRNVERYLDTGKIDLAYLTHRLGTDATKQVTRMLEMENKEEVKEYIKNLGSQLKEEKTDFRNFNFSKWKAKKMCNF